MRYLVGMVQGKVTPGESGEQVVYNRVFTIANVITVIRLAMIPAAYALLVTGEHNTQAFLVFAAAACTDWVDGQIARRTNTVTRLGKELDPLVDRFLLAAGVIGLLVVGRVPLWLAAVLITRDVLILSGSARLKLLGIEPIPVLFLGKVTTALLMAGFSGLILGWPEVPGLALVDSVHLPGLGTSAAPVWIWFIYVGAVLSVVTGQKYLRLGRERLARHTVSAG